MIQNPAYKQMVLDTFCTALDDASPAVRAKAAEALGKIGNVAIAPILLKPSKTLPLKSAAAPSKPSDN